MQKPSPWISGAEARAMLRVRPQTLYAYVSRGLIRARADEQNPQRSRYSAHDILGLVARKKRARRRRDIAAGAISWGEPVLETSISTVRDDCLIFRGEDAVLLSRTASLEDVAQLLWQSSAPQVQAASRMRFGRATSAKARGFEFLSKRAGVDSPSFGRSPAHLHVEAWEILSGFADALLGASMRGLIHERIGSVWSLDGRATDLVRRALVFSSDHELNPSTFAVRIAGSAGGSLASATLAGFCTLSGPLHGEALTRARDLLDRMCAADDPRKFVRQILAQGERIVAFGHPLYPNGDIRASELLRGLKPARRIDAAIRAGEGEIGRAPMFDMALAALAREFNLPKECSFVIFAIGRMAGWLAHALEQNETGRLMRPRARYVGP